jgi:hypothetical protein
MRPCKSITSVRSHTSRSDYMSSLTCLVRILQLSKSVGMKGNDNVQVIHDLDLPFPSQTCASLSWLIQPTILLYPHNVRSGPPPPCDKYELYMPFVVDLLHARPPREMLLDRNYVDDRECRLMMMKRITPRCKKKRDPPSVSPNFGEDIVYGR